MSSNLTKEQIDKFFDAALSVKQSTEKVRLLIKSKNSFIHLSLTSGEYAMVLDEDDKDFEQLKAILLEMTTSQPKDYIKIGPDEYILGDDHWITASKYASKYGLTINQLLQRIQRGIIPDDCIVRIEPLNNIKIIRDQEYATRTYSSRAGRSKKPENGTETPE